MQRTELEFEHSATEQLAKRKAAQRQGAAHCWSREFSIPLTHFD